jgi:branched-chain amino acid transport system permease protein
VSDLLLSYGNIINLCLLNSLLSYGVYLALSANLFTLATAGFMALGAYCSVFLTMKLGIPFGAAVVGGGAFSAIFAFVLGVPLLRLKGDYFALATFAFTEVVRIIALNCDSVTGGALGIINIPRYTQTLHLAALVALVIYLTWALRTSYIGRATATLREDDVLAASMGVDVFSYRLTLFVGSGLISGAAGALAAHLNFFIGPNDFGLLRSVDALAFPILGGLHWLLGPLIGAVVFTLLPEVFRFSTQLRDILMGGVLLLVVLFLPGGIMSVAQAGRKLSALLRMSGRATAADQ